MKTLVAVLCAVAAAVCLGLAGRFQHGAVKTGSDAGKLPIRAFLRLFADRRWMIGAAILLVGVGLHVVALGLAPLTIVQPLGVLSLVVIVLVGDGHHVTTARTWRAVAATCAGTIGFVLSAATSLGDQEASMLPWQAQLVVVAVLLLIVLGLRAGYRTRCLLLSASAAILYGLTSAFMRSALQGLEAHGWGTAVLLAAGEAAVLAALGAWLVQQAYAAGPAAVVIGTTTVGDPITAVLIGICLYGETPNLTPLSATLQIAFGALAVFGVIHLAREVPAPVAAPVRTIPAPEEPLLPDGPPEEPLLPADGPPEEPLLPDGPPEEPLLPDGPPEEALLPDGPPEEPLLPDGPPEEPLLPDGPPEEPLPPAVPTTAPVPADDLTVAPPAAPVPPDDPSDPPGRSLSS